MEKLVYNGGISTNLKRNKLKWLLIPSFFIGQLFAILKILRWKPVALIHAHWLIPQGCIAHLAVKLSNNKPPVICTSHGSDLFGLNNVLSIKIKQWVINKSKAISVVSNALKQRVLEITPQSRKKVSVIPMGTDLRNVFIPTNDVIRKNNMLLFVGRLVKTKGADLLIQAFSNIKPEHHKLELFIIGHGPEKSVLEQRVFDLKLQESIHFIGNVPHNELAHWYSKATISIFPFKGDEGFGLVLIEAIGCGCPVIVSDIPAIHDVIKHQKTGLIFAKNNIDALEKNILELLESPQKRMQLTSKAYQYVRKSFSWDRSYKDYLRLINKTLTENDR